MGNNLRIYILYIRIYILYIRIVTLVPNLQDCTNCDTAFEVTQLPPEAQTNDLHLNDALNCYGGNNIQTIARLLALSHYKTFIPSKGCYINEFLKE